MNSAMSLVQRPSQALSLSETQLGQLSLSDTKLPCRPRPQAVGRSSLGNMHTSSDSGERQDNAVARRVAGGFALPQAGSAAESVVAAFLGAHQRVLQKVGILPNAQQLLAVCEAYRADVFALLDKKFLPNVPALWTSAAMRYAAPPLAPAITAPDSSLVAMHQLLGSVNSLIVQEKHREYLEGLNVESLLRNTRAIMDEYALDHPYFNYDWLVEWLKVLRVLFPKWAGYVVLELVGDFEGVELDYGAVLTGDSSPKVLLIVKGFLGRWPGYERAGEFRQEWDLWTMSQQMRRNGVAAFPERMFWLCFRGVHCGCGWQEGAVFPKRVWPDDADIYHDIRHDESVRTLCRFAQSVVERMIRGQWVINRAVLDNCCSCDPFRRLEC
ncbi:uncharacterized protein LOC129582977 [Paramacrobiotus metropolitanus]|uniref:uncharacterized protein LOC129582977 n=1 Tax=Paramacrobiotus metropolitanus TaxID=2943436 RepID=UPI002445F2F9|nr:uncharacterized protein LOC129582977 [Paramacrobiotus metropolitanus]